MSTKDKVNKAHEETRCTSDKSEKVQEDRQGSLGRNGCIENKVTSCLLLPLSLSLSLSLSPFLHPFPLYC